MGIGPRVSLSLAKSLGDGLSTLRYARVIISQRAPPLICASVCSQLLRLVSVAGAQPRPGLPQGSCWLPGT